MTWTAAAFAEYSPAHRDEFVGYARHGIAFLDQVMRDKEHGGFHWMLDPQGRSIPGWATRSMSTARRSSSTPPARSAR